MLNKKQIKHLKTLAHALHPVVLMGARGMNDDVHREIHRALDAHELIKIKLPAVENALQKEWIAQIQRQHGAEFIQQIGHIAVFYRRHSETPKIEWPH